MESESLPTRECGLKFLINERTRKFYLVTPYAGVWIEILKTSEVEQIKTSLPTRECGLKFLINERTRKFYRHSLRGSVD